MMNSALRMNPIRFGCGGQKKQGFVAHRSASDSRMTPMRVTFGAISLSISTHFPPIENPKLLNSIRLPRGAYARGPGRRCLQLH